MPYFITLNDIFGDVGGVSIGPPSGTFNSIAKTHPTEMILSTESKALSRFNVVSSQNSFNRIDLLNLMLLVMMMKRRRRRR